MKKQKLFSARLNEIVMGLIEGNGRAVTAEALGLQSNFFSPSKYGPEKFATKSIGHLDAIEEYFGVDLLSGSVSALAREIDRAEADEALTQFDRTAILSIVRAARDRSADVRRGQAAVEKIKSLKKKSK